MRFRSANRFDPTEIERRQDPEKEMRGDLLFFTILLIVAILWIYVIPNYVYLSLPVLGHSMEPTFRNSGDTVGVLRLTGYAYGDIVIAVDAALGENEDVGRVKITKNGLFPGRALGRESKAVGDIGVLAVVGEKSGDNFARLAAGSEEFAEFMAKKTADITQELVEYIDRLAEEKFSPRGAERAYPALARRAELASARARV